MSSSASSAAVTGSPSRIPNVLTIAGIDPSGGAGVLADLKTFSALGAYGCGVIAALTAQNTHAVTAVHVPPTDFLRLQIDTSSTFVSSRRDPNARPSGRSSDRPCGPGQSPDPAVAGD